MIATQRVGYSTGQVSYTLKPVHLEETPQQLLDSTKLSNAPCIRFTMSFPV